MAIVLERYISRGILIGAVKGYDAPGWRRSPALDVLDVRFPTSRTLDGSDAMNPDPDYSAAYVIVRDRRRRRPRGPRPDVHDRARDGGRRGGGRRPRAARRRARHDELFDDMGGFWRTLVGDSQLRWIGPEKGVIHLATAAVVNAVWDLFAKRAGKPLWKLRLRHDAGASSSRSSTSATSPMP